MSANFRTLCHSLGLGAQGLANYVGVGKRNAEHWMTDGEPPQGVWDEIHAVDAWIERRVAAVLEQAAELKQQYGQPHDVALIAYKDAPAWWRAHPEFEGLPIQTHSAMLRRTQIALEREGFNVIVEFDAYG